jgi:hypothetical protein
LKEPYVQVEIGRPTDTWPPTGPDASDQVSVSVEYCDVQRIARYRLTASAILQSADGNLAVSAIEKTPAERIDSPLA